MADPPHSGSGPGDVPGVDVFAFLAAGFLPTHAPRPTDAPFTPTMQSVVARCCEATERDDRVAPLTQTPVEAEPARVAIGGGPAGAGENMATKKRWSRRVTERSNAPDLDPGVFTRFDPQVPGCSRGA